MASVAAVAEKSARADLRLAAAVERASKAFGVPFNRPSVPANRFPVLYAAEMRESVADFLERIAQAQEQR